MGRRGTRIDPRDLRLLAAQGLGMADMARELDVTYLSVVRSAQEHGIDVPQGSPAARSGPKSEQSRSELMLPTLRALAEDGLNTQAIAAKCGVSFRTIQLWARKHGIDIQKGRQGSNSERAARSGRMADMYKQGITLEKIGEKFGVTRERVRQLLKKQGITRFDGGQCKAVQARKATTTATRDARHLTRHGMPFSEYKALQKAGAVAVYRQQRENSRRRAIAWEITLAQWWSLWVASGKWEQRGRGKGRYVMSRIKDEGGYQVGNVHIQLATENSLEAVDKWRGHTKKVRGVFFLYAGSKRPYLAKVGKRYLGLFDTEEAAVAARMAFAQANGYRERSDGRLVKA